jgi:hypothetical protein
MSCVGTCWNLRTGNESADGRFRPRQLPEAFMQAANEVGTQARLQARFFTRSDRSLNYRTYLASTVCRPGTLTPFDPR